MLQYAQMTEMSVAPATPENVLCNQDIESNVTVLAQQSDEYSARKIMVVRVSDLNKLLKDQNEPPRSVLKRLQEDESILN